MTLCSCAEIHGSFTDLLSEVDGWYCCFNQHSKTQIEIVICVLDLPQRLVRFATNSPGSENIPVEKSSAPRFETWNGSRDPSETNLAWLDFLNLGQFCAIDHALF